MNKDSKCGTPNQIDCEAEACVYNHSHKCDATHVDIKGNHATSVQETACGTFREK